VLAHSPFYAIPIQGALSRTQLVPSPHRDEGVGRLIKLHGSLNWRYSGSDRAVGEEIYDIGLVPGWTDSPLNTAAVAAAPDKVPLVIPPTLEKSPFFINETVRGLWRLAKRALKKSGHWYVIGYSLPDGDHNMLGLLRNAIQGSPKLITVVNRDEAVAERYRRALRGLENIRFDVGFVDAGAEAFASAYLRLNDLGPLPDAKRE
jgi:hypothetical protein